MHERLLKISSAACVILTILICASTVYLPRLHKTNLVFSIERLEEFIADKTQRAGLDIISTDKNAIDFSQQLRINLPEDCLAKDVVIKNRYVTQTLELTVPTSHPEFLYDTPIIGSSENIADVVMEYSGGQAVIEIVFDRVLETKKTCVENFLYLDFVSPHDIYDKIVVIDAGHGGNMPGAIKQGIYEKDIDLAIVQELQKLMRKEANIGVYYTRTDDSNPSFDNRVGLANKVDADLFISIHNNSTTGARLSKVHGTQVVYDEKRSDKISKDFAEICLEEVTKACGSVNKGLVAGNDIFIVRTSEVPVALIEVGFMTNPDELKNLTTPEYQKKAAIGIYNAIKRAFREGY